jgi:hypothetical protein
MSIANRDPYQAREAEKYASPIPSRESIFNLRHEQGAPLLLNDLTDALALPEPYQLDEAVRRRDGYGKHYRTWIRKQSILLEMPPKQPGS